MKPHHFLIPTVVLACNLSAAQPTKEALTKEFSAVTTAVYTGKTDKVIEHTHPNFVKAVGGDSNYRKILNKGASYLKNKGVTFESASVTETTKTTKTAKAEYFFLKLNITASASKTKVTKKEVYLVIKHPSTGKWCYSKYDKAKKAFYKKVFPNVDLKKAPAE